MSFLLYPFAISIHAPTRGATLELSQHSFYHQISIHAPTRGATIYILSTPYCFTYFNPRSHEGSDTTGKDIQIDGQISIHAPTRGATLYFCVVMDLCVFQSTLPRGERQQFSPKSSLFSQQKLSKIFNLNNKLF